ncbi:unnamed protein product [Symbiodinium sp. KB8]|nr:unnamed protein product [Symbiodinium sp. KB8]
MLGPGLPFAVTPEKRCSLWNVTPSTEPPKSCRSSTASDCPYPAGESSEAIPCSLQERLLQHAEAQQEAKVHWEALLVVLPCFSGYAALFGLQHEVKARFRIADDSSDASHSFGAAVSCLYLFGLIFRIGHKVVFSNLHPRIRVLVALGFMMLSMLVMAVVILTLECYSLYWVVFAYALGGAAMGSFESNLLTCLTPLGSRTKSIAILGIPLGINSILIGGFYLMGPPLKVSVTAVFAAVAALNLMGMLIFALRIPRAAHETGGECGASEIVADCKGCRQWLPRVWHYPLAFAVDTFTLAGFSPGLSLYLYDQEVVQLTESFAMATKTFFAFYNTANMLGGLCGRWLSYRIRPRHPAVYVGFSTAGVLLLLSLRPVLAPSGAFLVMLGDGLIYGTISRYVDSAIPEEFNLIAISYWLFIGDIGSLVGSNLICYLRDIPSVQDFLASNSAPTCTAGSFFSSGAGAMSWWFSDECEDSVQISAGSNTILIFRPGMFDLECRTDEETLMLSASLLEHVDPLILTGNEVGDLDWLRCVEGPPGPEGHAINVVNLSSRLMAKYDEPEAQIATTCYICSATWTELVDQAWRCAVQPAVMPFKVPPPPVDDGFYVAVPSYKRAELIQRKTLAVLQRHGIPKHRIYIFVASESERSACMSLLGLLHSWHARRSLGSFPQSFMSGSSRLLLRLTSALVVSTVFEDHRKNCNPELST